MGGSWQTRVEAHRASVREDIIDAALALVSEHGVAGTTMSRLAERAGISRATLYKYFADVPQVLAAWVLDEVDRSIDHLESELAGVAHADAQLEVYVAELLRTWAGADHRFGVEQLSAGLPPEVADQMAAQMDRLRRVLADVLDQGVRDGSMRSDLDPHLHADLVLHMLGGLRTGILRLDRPVDEVTALVVRLLRHGLVAGS